MTSVKRTIITKKITTHTIKKEDQFPIVSEINHEVLSSETVRPEKLVGSTYTLVNTVTEQTYYITINDIILNQGTDSESRQPYEIFINTKDQDSFQFILILTRLISAIFRHGGDSKYMVDEMKAVYSPNGSYFKKGGGFRTSLISDIGHTIENHILNMNKI
jgi:hypothetical protein